MEQNETEGTLVPSTNRGRYALTNPVTGPDLTSGTRLALYLGGQWIPGTVEHGTGYYVQDGGQWSTAVIAGYVFHADDGGTCGLCTGMHVRLMR